MSCDKVPCAAFSTVGSYAVAHPPFPFCRCPACRAFKPAFEAVAETIAERGDATPKIAVARVDCPDNTKICEQFGITGYPTMWVGSPEQVLKRTNTGLSRLNPAQRTKEMVLKALEEAIHT